MRWLEGFERRAEWAATLSDTRLVYVADRECNIHECMIRARRWPVPPPVIPPPLPIMLGWIARLGGPSGRECDGPPGPQALWIGLQRARDLAWGMQLASDLHTQSTD